MRIKKIVRLLTVLLIFPFALSAQVTTSTISGTVKDEKGAGLEGATVKVTNTQNGAVKLSRTDKSGRYMIPNLDPGGPYIVSVSFVGQNIQDKKDVFLQLGNTEVLDFAAQTTANVLEAVVVNTRTSRTVKTGTGSNFNQRAITTLPNISRSITNIATLTPQAGAGNSFGGRDGRYNNIQIDGASFNNNFGLSNNPLPGGAVQPISLDAIEEISVNVSPFDVRQANFTGAGINATTKKGTNKFRGSVYGFFRNEGFLGREAVGQKVPTVTQSTSKTFGATIGGPIIKNKLFFFLSAESVEFDAPGINWKASRGAPSSDPNESRTQYDSLVAVSNYLKTKFGYETGPFENLGNFFTKNEKILGRLDWIINTKHSASFRYNYSKTDDDQLLNGNSAPNPRGSNRWSNVSMSYENSNYANTNLLTSYAFELKSNFNNRLSNQFIATYTKANDPKRSSKSSLFPFIDIWSGGDSYISAGYELFSYNNDVQNNTLTFNDNVTYTAGKHTLTAGAAYEKIYVKNYFMRYGTSYYRFSSVNAFLTNQAPTAFAITFPVPGRTPFVELDFGQASLYAQDEIKFNDKFKLTVGLRADRPLFKNDMLGNSSISALSFYDTDGKAFNIDVSKWSKERTYLSPRIGFNWDVEGNKDMIIRGGVGVFTGRFPFVWFTNQPSNSGTSVVPYEVTSAATLGNYLFNPDPNAYVSSFPTTVGTPPLPSSLAAVDKDFKMPQVLRISAAVDKKLANDWTLTLEGIYNKDINALLQYNANQKAPIGVTFGAGSRPLYGNTTATRRYNTGISEAMILTNSSKGGAGIFTAQVSKRFNKNWDFTVAYTHTESFDLSGNPGSQASSAWSNIQSRKGNNNLDLAYSDYGTPNRVVAYASYKANWNKFLNTTFTLVYTGYEQGRFSYRYSNDYNQDGLSTNDLI
ncbi:TonB-dependent receptor [Ferruginibacter sp.]|nr:TonB-dependent receptor [Ferruginibacter sp.]